MVAHSGDIPKSADLACEFHGVISEPGAAKTLAWPGGAGVALPGKGEGGVEHAFLLGGPGRSGQSGPAKGQAKGQPRARPRASQGPARARPRSIHASWTLSGHERGSRTRYRLDIKTI